MTILEQLDNERIFNIELRENQTVARLEESCDNYFWHDLSKDDLGRLIEELQDLHGQMRTAS